MLEAITDIALLVLLGLGGWGIFSLLHFPAPPLLGTIFVIGALRGMNYPLPFAPNFLSPIVQIALGIFVGSKITKETLSGLKTIIKPAMIIAAWALSIVFILGGLLYKTTDLDLYTAMLSSSIGGLPEMTILALDTNADLGVVVIMQTIRMILAASIFPIIVKLCLKDDVIEEDRVKTEVKISRKEKMFSIAKLKDYVKGNSGHLRYVDKLVLAIGKILPTVMIAAAGGFLFRWIGVPAGGMIGAMAFVVAASLWGVKIKKPPAKGLQLVLIGVGITVSDNISQETLQTLTSGELLLPVMIATLFIFATSFLVTWIIHKVMKWDLATSFLVASPGGFTVMSALAIKYDKEPFKVSMLQLCRLLAIKIVILFVFMVMT